MAVPVFGVELKPWVMSGVILGLVLLCYWPALRGGTVWDDPAHITPPELSSWAGLGRIWSDLHATQQYYPLLYSAFWIEHRLWGDATLGYHLVNVLLHATACILFALVLRRLWDPLRSGSSPAPGANTVGAQRAVPAGTEWLAAILFAVHPVGVESVAWISEQKNVLSLAFYLAAVFVYLDFAATRRRLAYLGAAGFFLLALATKTVTATLPAALLVLLWWRNGRLRWRDIGPLLPWFLASALAGSITAWVERVLLGANGAGYDLAWSERVLLAGRVIGFYLGKLVWPADLMFIYPRWDVKVAAGGWWPWLAGVIAVTIALGVIRRRSRGPLAGWLFFVGSLFPALGFFNVYPFAFSYVADHFQYLASLGVIAVAAAGLSLGFVRLTPPLRVVGHGLCVGLIGVLVLLSHRQSGSYRDCTTLYRATLEKNPACWLAHNNLAVEIQDSPGQIPEALAHYAEALRLKPDNAEIHNNLGNLLVTLGRETEAILQFEEAIRLDPAFLSARLNLAHALANDPRRLPAAMEIFADTLRQNPESAAAHFSRAEVLAAADQRETDAAAEFVAALRLQPNHAEVHARFADLLTRIPEREADVEREYRAALRLAPENAKAHCHYAVWLDHRPGREAEARVHFEAALRINPTYAYAHNNLAIHFAKGRQFDLARAHFEAAVKAQPDYEEAVENLRLLDELTRR